jgi:large subunit ribosomal protein L17
MRHRFDHRKLGRKKPHRKAMLSNMVTSLFAKERITTTDPKAKEARREAERLITRAKKGYTAFKEHQSHKEAGREAESKQMQAVALAHWREAGRVVRDRTVLKKLFDELAPLYMERPGGYTRIVKIGNRLGDNARTVLLELVETKVTREPLTKKTKKKGEKEEGAEGDKGKKKKKAPKAKGSRGETGGEKKRGARTASKPLTTKRTAKEKRPEGA